MPELIVTKLTGDTSTFDNVIAELDPLERENIGANMVFMTVGERDWNIHEMQAYLFQKSLFVCVYRQNDRKWDVHTSGVCGPGSRRYETQVTIRPGSIDVNLGLYPILREKTRIREPFKDRDDTVVPTVIGYPRNGVEQEVQLLRRMLPVFGVREKQKVIVVPVGSDAPISTLRADSAGLLYFPFNETDGRVQHVWKLE